MRWDSKSEALKNGSVRKVTLLCDGRPADFAEIIERWQSDPGFRDYFIALLAAAPFQAYFWEMPPILRAKRSRDFEFVLAEGTTLAGLSPDPTAFAQQFEAADDEAEVTAFWNLGGDALLVAPCPRAPAEAYPHLAAFSWEAPREQQHAFWRLVGEKVAENLSDRPLWLSTSGLGVPWLHVRLDLRPKYYTFQPYQQICQEQGGHGRKIR